MKDNETQEVKPRFPDPAPRFTAFIEGRLTLDFDRFSNGKLSMTFEGATISDGEGNKLGTVNPTLGGGVQVCIGSRHYSFDARQLWEAAKEVDRQYLESVSA